MKRLVLLALLATVTGAQPWEKLRDIAGVNVGKVNYIASETRRDPLIEAALVKAMEIPDGQEVRYLYNRVSLTPGGKQVLVLLVGPYFTGSGGSSMAVLEPLDKGYRIVTDFTLVNSPVLISSHSSKGWKDLIWLVRGGGVKAHYATLHFDGKSYPSNPSSVAPMPAGSLNGPAYLADPIHPEVGLKFVVGASQ